MRMVWLKIMLIFSGRCYTSRQVIGWKHRKM